MTRTASPRRSIEGLSDTEDMLIGMVTALAAQLSATRERLDTLERLLASKDVILRKDIEEFVVDEPAMKERDAMRQRLIERVFRAMDDMVAADTKRDGRSTDAG